jgi:hypothetical protein
LKGRIIFSGYTAPAAEGGLAMAWEDEIDPGFPTRPHRADGGAPERVDDAMALATDGADSEFGVGDR